MAGSRIKGITIELDGDTRGLDQALRNVNQRSRDLYSELKDVERLLKFNPGNTELLAQQQRLLAEQVENTSEKLQQLRDAQEQVQQQFERGEIDEGQYRAFQRELIATEGRLEHFQNQLAETQAEAEDTGESMAEMADRFQGAGEGMKNAGTTLTAGVTVPLLGIGAAAIKTADDFDKASGKLRAQLGLTADQTKELDEVVRNLWLNAFGESIGEVSDNVAILYQQLGNLPADEMEAIAEAAYTLSDAFGVDIQESARAASQLMQQFGVDSEQAMDMLTAAFQRGGDYSGELLDTITEYSTQFANLGFTAEQMMGLLVSGAESGIFSMDKLADTVKESFLQITDGADNTRGALKELGLNSSQIESDLAAGGDKANVAFMAVMTAIAGVTKEADRNRLAIELMGTPLEDLGPQYQAFFTTATDGMTDFEGAAKEAADSLYDNFGSRLTSSLRSLQDALAPIGDTLITLIESAIPHVEKFVEMFTNLSPAMQQTILIVAGIVAALGPLIFVIGTVVTTIASLITIFGALGVSIGALMLPVTLIIAGIAALIAIGVALYKNWDEIRAKGIEIFTNVLNFLVNTWNLITSAIGTALDWIDQQTNGKFTSITNTIRNFMTLAGDVIARSWQFIKDSFSNALKFAKALLSGDFDTMWQVVRDQMGNIKTTISDIWGKVMSFFEGIDLSEIGADIIRGLISGLASMAGAIARKVSELASLIPDGMKDFLGIHSPSRLMRDEIGKWIPLGVAEGISRNAGAIDKASADMMANAIPTLPRMGAGGISAAGASTGGALGGSNTFNFSGMMQGATFIVRNDYDIEKIAQQLGDYVTMQARKGGVVFGR